MPTQCATRCYTPNVLGDNSTYAVRTAHYVRNGAVSSIQVGWVNWYTDSTSSGGEGNPGGTLTINWASIEYPAGVFHVLTFSGSGTATVANGGEVLSDALSLSIPDDALFWVRVGMTHSSTIPYCNTNMPTQNVALGDAILVSSTNYATSGTIVDAGWNIQIFPSMIVTGDSRTAIGIGGDSRANGYGDRVVDSTGDLGFAARAIGGTYPYINVATPAETAATFWASHTKRAALLNAYCNRFWFDTGVNDVFNSGASAATIEATINNIVSLFPSGMVWWSDLYPESNSTDNWATTANQTTLANESARVGVNDWLRAGPAGIHFIETADSYESARNSGKFKANGTAFWMTIDGIHGSSTGDIQAAAAISPTVFELTQVGGSIELTCTGGGVGGGTQTLTIIPGGVSFNSIGTPAYSTASGTSVAPSYPAGITSDLAVFMLVGQKPSTANGGTITTPSGWSQVAQLFGAGGYGSTLGSNTGNTNLVLLRKDTVTGSETGSVSVTVGTNNVAWAVIFTTSKSQSTSIFDVAAVTGSDTTAGNVSVTGGSDPGIRYGDLVVFAFGKPTNLATQSAPALSATGVTFESATEDIDAGTTVGNRAGELIFHARATAGTSSVAPVATSTTGGTTTNARGPGIIARIREVSSAATSSLVASATVSGTLSGSATIAAAIAASVSASPTLQAGAALSGALSAADATSGAALATGALTQTHDNQGISTSGSLTAIGGTAAATSSQAAGAVTAGTATVILAASSTHSATASQSGYTQSGSFALRSDHAAAAGLASTLGSIVAMSGAQFATVSLVSNVSGAVPASSSLFASQGQVAVLSGRGALVGNALAGITQAGVLVVGLAAISASSQQTVTSGAVSGVAPATAALSQLATLAGSLGATGSVAGALGSTADTTAFLQGLSTNLLYSVQAATVVVSGTPNGAAALVAAASQGTALVAVVAGAGVAHSDHTATVDHVATVAQINYLASETLPQVALLGDLGQVAQGVSVHAQTTDTAFTIGGLGALGTVMPVTLTQSGFVGSPAYMTAAQIQAAVLSGRFGVLGYVRARRAQTLATMAYLHKVIS